MFWATIAISKLEPSLSTSAIPAALLPLAVGVRLIWATTLAEPVAVVVADVVAVVLEVALAAAVDEVVVELAGVETAGSFLLAPEVTSRITTTATIATVSAMTIIPP